MYATSTESLFHHHQHFPHSSPSPCACTTKDYQQPQRQPVSTAHTTLSLSSTFAPLRSVSSPATMTTPISPTTRSPPASSPASVLHPTLIRRTSSTKRAQKIAHRVAVRRIITASHHQSPRQQQHNEQQAWHRNLYPHSSPHLPSFSKKTSYSPSQPRRLRHGAVTEAVLRDQLPSLSMHSLNHRECPASARPRSSYASYTPSSKTSSAVHSPATPLSALSSVTASTCSSYSSETSLFASSSSFYSTTSSPLCSDNSTQCTGHPRPSKDSQPYHRQLTSSYTTAELQSSVTGPSIADLYVYKDQCPSHSYQRRARSVARKHCVAKLKTSPTFPLITTAPRRSGSFAAAHNTLHSAPPWTHSWASFFKDKEGSAATEHKRGTSVCSRSSEGWKHNPPLPTTVRQGLATARHPACSADTRELTLDSRRSEQQENTPECYYSAVEVGDENSCANPWAEQQFRLASEVTSDHIHQEWLQLQDVGKMQSGHDDDAEEDDDNDVYKVPVDDGVTASLSFLYTNSCTNIPALNAQSSPTAPTAASPLDSTAASKTTTTTTKTTTVTEAPISKPTMPTSQPATSTLFTSPSFAITINTNSNTNTNNNTNTCPTTHILPKTHSTSFSTSNSVMLRFVALKQLQFHQQRLGSRYSRRHKVGVANLFQWTDKTKTTPASQFSPNNALPRHESLAILHHARSAKREIVHKLNGSGYRNLRLRKQNSIASSGISSTACSCPSSSSSLSSSPSCPNSCFASSAYARYLHSKPLPLLRKTSLKRDNSSKAHHNHFLRKCMATYRNKPLPLIPFQFLTSEKSEIGQQQEACRPLDFDLDMDAPHCSRDLPKTVNNKAVLKAGIPSWCGKNWGEAHFDNIDHGLVPRLPEKIGNEESPDGPPDTKTTTVHHGQKQELLFTCLPLRLQGAMKEDVEEEKAGAKPCSSTQQEKAEVAPHEHKDNIIANCTIADSAIGKSIIETHNIGGIGMEVEVTRSLPSHTSEKIPHMPSSLSSPSFMVQSAERDSNGHTSDTGTLGAVDNAIVSVSEGIALEDKIQSTNTNIELQPPPQPSSFSQLTVSLPGGRMNSFRFPPRKDPIESQPHLQQPPHARTRQYHHLHHQSLPPIYARRSVSPLLLSRIQSPSAASPSSLDSHHRSTSTSVATVSSVSSSSCSTCACKLTNVSSLLQNHACDRSTIETIDGANGHLGREDSNTAARQSLTEETDTLSQQPQQQQKQQSEYQQTTQQKQRRRSTLRRSESCHLVLRSHRPTLSFNSSKDALLSLQARRINKPDAKVLRLPDIQTTATSNSNINTTAPTTAAVTTSPVQPKVTTSYPKNGGQPSVTVQTSTNLTIVKDDQTNSSSESCVLPQEHLILNSQEKLIKSQDGDDDDDDDDGQEDYQLRVSDRDRTVTDALLVEMTTLDAFKADSTAAGESTSTTPTPTTTNTMAASSLADQSTLSEDVCSTMGNITKVNKQVSMATRSPIEEDDGHIANLENAKATAAMSMATLATETPDITSDAGEIKRFVKRSHALCELETTEETYVDDLDTLIHVHLRVLEMRHWFPQALHGRLVRCCHELLKGQRNFLSRLAMVKMAETDHERAPLAVYRNMTEAFDVLQQATHLYAEFCELRTRTLVHLNKHAPGGSTLTLLQKEGNDLLIQQGRRNSRADLKDYLIKPIQRVCRYPLLLREILRLTQVQDPEHGVVVQAYDQMREMAQAMDEAQRAVERMMLTERFLKKIPESTPPPRKVATGHGGTNMAALVSSVPILMDVGRGPYYHEGNGYFEDYKGEDVFMTAGGGDIVESQEGIAPSAITKTMLSESAGSIVLAGALEYVLTPNVPIRLKYYGCFLFETMLVIVKPKKSNQYEIRQWLPLRFCEIHETTRLDGYTRFGWRIVFDQFGIDFGASSSSEQQVWITTLQSRIQAAKEMHEFALRDGVKSAPISSSLPWGTPSSLVYVPRSTYSRSNNSNTGSGSRRYSGHVRPSSMATVSGGMTPSPSPWSACSSAIPSPLMPPPPAGQTTHTTLVMAPPLAGFGGDFSGDGESGRGWDMLGPESALANYANGALDHHFMHNNNNQAQTPGLSGAKYSSLSRTDISISSASISTTGDQRGGTSKSSTATSPSGATIRIGGMAGNSIGSNYSSTSMLTSSVSGNSHDQDATCLSMASHPHHHHHQQQQQQQQPNSSHYHQPHNAPVSDYQYRIQSVPQQKQQQQQQQQQYMSYPTAPAAMSIASAWLMAEQRSRSHSFDVSRVFTSNTNNVIKPTQRTLVQNLFKDVSSENVWTTATSVQQSSGSNSSGTNGSTAPSASNSTGAITTATSTSITTTTNNNCVANSSSVSVRGAAVGGGDGIPGSASLLVHSHTGVMSGMTSSVSASTLSSCNSTRTTIGVCDDEENGCQATVAPPGTAVSSSSSTTSLTSRLLRRRDSGSNCGGSGGSSGNGSGRIPMPNATVNIIQERNDWDRRRSSATAAIAATLNLNFRSHKNQNQNTTNPSSVISSTPHSRSNILGINHQQQHHHHHHSRHTHDMSMSTTTMDQAPNTIGTSQTVPPKPVSLQNQNHQDNSVKSRAQFFEKRSSLPVFASSDLLYSSSSSHATTISTTATTTKAEAASATAVVAEVEVAATGILPNATRASMVSAATTGRQSSLQAPPPASSSSSSMKISRMEIGQSPMISFNAKTRHHHTASEEVAGGSGSTVPIVVYDPAEYLKNDDDKTQGDDEECEVDREQMKVNKVGKEDKDEEEEEDVDLLLTSLNSAGEAARSRRSTRGLSSRGSSPTFASSSGLSSSNNNDEDDDRKRRKGHDSILSVMEIPAIYSPVPVPAPVHVSASALSPFKDNGQHETSCQYPQARQRQQSQQQSQQQQQQQQQQPVLPNKDGSMEKKLWSTMGRLTQKQKKISTRHSRSATFNQDSESIESAFGGGVEDNCNNDDDRTTGLKRSLTFRSISTTGSSTCSTTNDGLILTSNLSLGLLSMDNGIHHTSTIDNNNNINNSRDTNNSHQIKDRDDGSTVLTIGRSASHPRVTLTPSLSLMSCGSSCSCSSSISSSSSSFSSFYSSSFPPPPTPSHVESMCSSTPTGILNDSLSAPRYPHHHHHHHHHQHQGGLNHQESKERKKEKNRELYPTQRSKSLNILQHLTHSASQKIRTLMRTPSGGSSDGGGSGHSRRRKTAMNSLSMTTTSNSVGDHLEEQECHCQQQQQQQRQSSSIVSVLSEEGDKNRLDENEEVEAEAEAEEVAEAETEEKD